MTTPLDTILASVFADITRETVLDTRLLTVDGAALYEVLKRLKTYPDLDFSLLLDITAVDYLTYPKRAAARFVVVYTLRNWKKKLPGTGTGTGGRSRHRAAVGCRSLGLGPVGRA
jgi:NADH-quinone oxidoreductase subunit C/D